MRTYAHRNKTSVKLECFKLFPDGNISKQDRQNNRGLFVWIDRNMGGFNSAYNFVYGREYVDKRTLVDKTGKNNGRYIDGRTPEVRKARTSKKYKEWRMMVFGRDNFTCQDCGKRGCYLEAHHIKPFSTHKHLRFNVNNGITYCKACHIKNDIYRGRRGNKN